MKKLGLYDLTPAMCHLDYTMGEAGGASNFVREYTLASGGPYCDCGYQSAAKVGADASVRPSPRRSEISLLRRRRLSGDRWPPLCSQQEL